ncbi:hypothetical protein FHETE_3252 [Fusarium heterosporum]|uniref:Uncharacterized protein n=1 Tax=Fusarium heterosporum TaxID=42747 RepID=A0A8H5WWT1_FUSHE|nr:hypothetical protein FHETE_3252 [Fusarium heterosporum]
MPDLDIYMVISRKYQVFDQSGKLPFSIIFGLCRRSSDDADPRPLRLSTRQTILDVPYALSHNLLQLRKYNAKTKTDIQVDTWQMDSSSGNESYLTLPSPVGKTDNWTSCLTEYHYRVNPGSELASLFETGGKYTIKNFTGWKLGADKYAYIDEQGGISPPSKEQKLVCRRASGRPTFEVVESLPWPPEIQTKMQRYKDTNDNTTLVDVTVTNLGGQAVTVQTRGRQCFLIPHGAYQPEEDFPPEDPRPRIIDPEISSASDTIQVFDLSTNKVVRRAKGAGPGGCGHPQKDLRPKLDTLMTLRPGDPLLRRIDVSNILSDLPDGEYGLRMEPRGMWWCNGDREDFGAEAEDRVPHDIFSTLIPPLMLKSEDIVKVQVENCVARA